LFIPGKVYLKKRQSWENRNSMESTITLGKRKVAYRVRVSARAQRPALSVSGDRGLEVIVPSRARLFDPLQLLREKQHWISKKLDYFERSRLQDPLLRLRAGESATLLGRELRLRVIPSESTRTRVAVHDGLVTLHTPRVDNESIHRALRAWCKVLAKGVIPRRVAHLNRAPGLPLVRVSVRDQKTRWGSCSRRGTVSLNWRLVLLPLHVMDYLILHELAHLRHMNHSRRFWHYVAALYPDFREAERWLRRHGQGMIS
jgi:predicted metal-dependent hydrolase